MITKDAENFNSNTYWFDIHLPISEGWETAELEREYFLRRDKSEGAGVLLHLMLLRSISAHYEIIGANLIHCRNVSHSQTIPDFLSLRSSWFIYHLGAEGEGIPFIFVIREQLWFIYHLGAWGGGGEGFSGGNREGISRLWQGYRVQRRYYTAKMNRKFFLLTSSIFWYLEKFYSLRTFRTTFSCSEWQPTSRGASIGKGAGYDESNEGVFH